MSSKNLLIRYSHRLWISVLMLVSVAGNAAALSIGDVAPSTWFLQAGLAEQHTQTYAAGATWEWNWRREYSFGTVYGYSEASVGRWITDVSGGSSAWETQLGVTPVLRLQASDAGYWFAEIGIGANLILPIYRSEDKRFSTTFNFGDHFAIGRQFGIRNRDELALRIQHFSNGGIDHPNPGENFVQLRYSRRY